MDLKTSFIVGLVALGAVGVANAADCTCRPIHHAHRVFYRRAVPTPPYREALGYGYPVPYVVEVPVPVYERAAPAYGYPGPVARYGWDRHYGRPYGIRGGYGRNFHEGYGRDDFQGRGSADGGYPGY